MRVAGTLVSLAGEGLLVTGEGLLAGLGNRPLHGDAGLALHGDTGLRSRSLHRLGNSPGHGGGELGGLALLGVIHQNSSKI